MAVKEPQHHVNAEVGPSTVTNLLEYTGVRFIRSIPYLREDSHALAPVDLGREQGWCAPSVICRQDLQVQAMLTSVLVNNLYMGWFNTHG